MTVLSRLLCLCVFLFLALNANGDVLALKANGEETLEQWHPDFARAYFEKAGSEGRSASKLDAEPNPGRDSRRACAQALTQKDNDRIRQYCDEYLGTAPTRTGALQSVSVESDDGGSSNESTATGSTSGRTCYLDFDTADYLYTQSDVDAFPADCEYISGPLVLINDIYFGFGNSLNDPITDLTPLSGIREIYGNLYIYSLWELRAIDPLANLKYVSGLVEVNDNRKLVDIQGLKGLSYAGGGLVIDNNDLLESLNGLQNITQLANNAVLYIFDNPNLTDLNYFDGLKSGYHDPWIVSIINNGSLKTLTGLEWIDRIDTALYIQNNPKLTDVAALAPTTSVGSSFNNTGTPEFVVTGNGQLNDCAGLANALGWPEVYYPLSTVFVENNGASSSCSSAADILQSVSGPSTIQTKSYTAENGRLIWDFTDSTSDPTYPVLGYVPFCTTSSSASDTAKTELPDYQIVDRYLLPVPNGIPEEASTNLTEVWHGAYMELDVSHDFPEQLIIDLTFPSGRTVNLRNQEGDGTSDIVAQYPRDLSTEETEQAWWNAQASSLDGAFQLSLLDNVGPVNGISREGTLNQWRITTYQDLYAWEFSSSSVVEFDQMINGNPYECTVWPETYLGYFGSLLLELSFTQKLVPPAAPAVAETRPDIDSARVVVSPAYPAGEEISKYQVTCRGDEQGDTVVAESADAWVNIDGLEGGSTYTCTAKTYNASGYGAASSSFVLEPEALQAGLPIWLLYEAMKNNRTP